MKRAVGFLAALVLTVGLVRPCWGVELTLTSHAALLMEKSTGEILYAQNEHDALPPASVTKIMTVLLTMEAIDSGRIALDDMVLTPPGWVAVRCFWRRVSRCRWTIC